ncbi:hypothetical protein [Streptomyces sp. NPDC051218]|uniref:hypothetical protein n=1 Tax=Streptomyces sp. NPDC051218 TaxID=3365645 RepID=UPI0037A07E62
MSATGSRTMLRTLSRGVWVYPKVKVADGEDIAPYAVPVAVWELIRREPLVTRACRKLV